MIIELRYNQTKFINKKLYTIRLKPMNDNYIEWNLSLRTPRYKVLAFANNSSVSLANWI